MVCVFVEVDVEVRVDIENKVSSFRILPHIAHNKKDAQKRPETQNPTISREVLCPAAGYSSPIRVLKSCINTAKKWIWSLQSTQLLTRLLLDAIHPSSVPSHRSSSLFVLPRGRKRSNKHRFLGRRVYKIPFILFNFWSAE